MVYATTKKEYDSIKDKRFTVVIFEPSGKRAHTYGGLGAVMALEHVIEQQKIERHGIIIEEPNDIKKDLQNDEEGLLHEIAATEEARKNEAKAQAENPNFER